MSISGIKRLAPQTTSLFVCDIQERFKGLIWQYPSVISVAGKMVSRYYSSRSRLTWTIIDKSKQTLGHTCCRH